MGTTGIIYPGTISEDAVASGAGSIAWTNPNNAKTDNATDATVVLTPLGASKFLIATAFDWSAVPTGVPLRQITVYVKSKEAGGALPSISAVRLFSAGAIVAGSTNYGSLRTVPAAYASYPFGVGSWGVALTQANLISTFGFGIVITDQEPGCTPGVDYLAMKVDWGTSGGGIARRLLLGV